MLSLAGPAAGGVLENLSWCQILGSCWILGLCQSKVKVWDLREKKWDQTIQDSKPEL